MVSLRKLFLIPATLVAFAGIASAAATIACVPAAISTAALRSEGRTEKLTAITLNCTPSGAALALPAAFQLSVTASSGALFTSPAAPDASSPTITVGGAAAVGATVTVTPTSVFFSGVLLPTTNGAAYAVVIDNLFADATQLPPFSSISLTVSAISGNSTLADSKIFSAGVSNTALLLNVATIGKSLSVYDSLTVGGIQKPTTLNACATETIDVTKVAAIGNGHIIDTVTFAPLGVNSFTTGTRLEVTISNMPSGVQFYVPFHIAAIGGTVADLIAGYDPATLAGGYTAKTVAGATDLLGMIPATGVIVYQITTPGIDLISFDIAAVANGPVLATLPVSIKAGYAPVGGTAIPNFGAGTTISSGFLTVAPCQSSLFFPYVVAGGGYDTGIAISSSGTFGDASKAASGQCVISYMGKGAPMTTKTLDVTVGQTSAFDIVGSMPTANFFGYAVAKCNFLDASGYAYVANSTGGTASYLPLYMAK